MARSAYDIPDLRSAMPDLTEEELRSIPIQEPGTPLDTNTTYFDLKHPSRGTLQGTSGMTVDPDSWLVAQSQVDGALWSLLVGADSPQRLGTRIPNP